MDHLHKIRETFSDQAKAFGNNSLTLAREDYLTWMLESLPMEANYKVLDVAAGTAHLSRAIAPHVKEVIAFDLTPAMLAEGEKEAANAGIQNIIFKVGNAESLPFDDNSFDLVVSRFAVHHFSDPKVQLAEMARVCKPAGYVGIIDMVSPQDSNMAEKYNHWEWVRDPSHTVALIPDEFTRLISDMGLTLSASESREIEVDVERWLDLTNPPGQSIAELKEAIKRDLDGESPTGLRPFVKEDNLKFWQTWMIIIGDVPI